MQDLKLRFKNYIALFRCKWNIGLDKIKFEVRSKQGCPNKVCKCK